MSLADRMIKSYQLGCAISATIFSLIWLGGCATIFILIATSKSPSQDTIHPAIKAAIASVDRFDLPLTLKDAPEWRHVPLAGGTALKSPFDGYYWQSPDNTLYASNGYAMMWSSKLPVIVGISAFDIDRALDGEPAPVRVRVFDRAHPDITIIPAPLDTASSPASPPPHQSTSFPSPTPSTQSTPSTTSIQSPTSHDSHPSPGEAGLPLITPEEFASIKKGMTYRHLTDIIGAPGELITETKTPPSAIYRWTNPDGLATTIILDNNRVTTFTQNTLTKRTPESTSPSAPTPLPTSHSPQRSSTPPTAPEPSVSSPGESGPHPSLSPDEATETTPPQSYEPKVSTEDDTTVYITDTGAKYHRSTCRTLKKSKHPIPLTNALNNGYEPCGICKP